MRSRNRALLALALAPAVLGVAACSTAEDQGAGRSSATAPDLGPAGTAAVAAYEGYVAGQADELLARTTHFVALVKAGKVGAAKDAYSAARGPWERIEPVAETFGDLDPKVDGRADVVADGMRFTGFHRLEKDLWVDGLRADSAAVADQLLTDVTEVATRAKKVQLTPVQLATGAKELLDEVATGKITGEEERYSHTDLVDFDENVKGSQAALAALRPVLEAKDPDLLSLLDRRFAALLAALEPHRTGSGFVPYTTLSSDEVRTLAAAVDATSEPVAQVAVLVGGA